MQCNGKSLLPLSTLPTVRSSSLRWRKADCSSDHKGRALLYPALRRERAVRWPLSIYLLTPGRTAAAVWLSAR